MSSEFIDSFELNDTHNVKLNVAKAICFLETKYSWLRTVQFKFSLEMPFVIVLYCPHDTVIIEEELDDQLAQCMSDQNCSDDEIADQCLTEDFVFDAKFRYQLFGLLRDIGNRFVRLGYSNVAGSPVLKEFTV